MSDIQGLLIRFDSLCQLSQTHQGVPQGGQGITLPATLTDLLGLPALTAPAWREAIAAAVATQEHICEQVYRTRKKDFDDPFRQRVFAGAAEMRAVLGTAEDAAFVRQTREQTEQFKQLAAAIAARTA